MILSSWTNGPLFLNPLSFPLIPFTLFSSPPSPFCFSLSFPSSFFLLFLLLLYSPSPSPPFFITPHSSSLLFPPSLFSPPFSFLLHPSFSSQVITSFSVAQSRQLLHSPQHSSTAIKETDEGKVVRSLVEECYENHRRSFFGVLPPEQCKLTTLQSSTLVD